MGKTDAEIVIGFLWATVGYAEVGGEGLLEVWK